MLKSVVFAYATKVRAGTMILDENDRKTKTQKLVPETYKEAVADYLFERETQK